MVEFKCTLGMKMFLLVGVATNPSTGLQQWPEHRVKRRIKDEADSHLLFASHDYSEPVLSGSETVLSSGINISPLQAPQISVTARFVRLVEVDGAKCMYVCSPPASAFTSFVCCSSHFQKNAGSKSIFPNGRPPSGSSVFGAIHESHEYSGKVPELAPLPLIKYTYTKKYYIPLQVLSYESIKNKNVLFRFSP